MALNLTDASLDWALRHAQAYGDTDIFPETFEFDALAYSWDTVKIVLKSIDILKWTVRPARRCLVPKHRFGFRISTQLDPLDFLILTALIKDVGEKLEMQRIPIAQNIVHSYRFSPASNGRMYSEDQTYRSFQKASQTLSDDPDITHVVIADIADFFPRIYTHRIDNALDGALGVGHMHSKRNSCGATWRARVSRHAPQCHVLAACRERHPDMLSCAITQSPPNNTGHP